ncbi:MAG: PHP domain-containing protein [Methanomassiliicoccales archaeon]
MESRADIHVHTKYSGIARLGFLRFPESVVEPYDAVKKAQNLGLKVLAITDHNSIYGAIKAKEFGKEIGMQVVVGEEISTSDGEIIGLYLNEEIPPGLTAEETIDRIRDQDGIVMAPHPFSLHCPSLGEKIAFLDIDAIETINAGHIDGYANSIAAQKSESGKWAIVGGSDSHSISTIAHAYTTFEGETAEDLRKAIFSKTTAACGARMPLQVAISWSIGVVLASDFMILKSILGMIKEVDLHDPVIKKISLMTTGKKLLALVGSLIYLTPPVPYLCAITGEKLLKRLARKHEAENEYKLS